jgi:hypothetical protein
MSTLLPSEVNNLPDLNLNLGANYPSDDSDDDGSDDEGDSNNEQMLTGILMKLKTAKENEGNKRKRKTSTESISEIVTKFYAESQTLCVDTINKTINSDAASLGKKMQKLRTEVKEVESKSKVSISELLRLKDGFRARRAALDAQFASLQNEIKGLDTATQRKIKTEVTRIKQQIQSNLADLEVRLSRMYQKENSTSKLIKALATAMY